VINNKQFKLLALRLFNSRAININVAQLIVVYKVHKCHTYSTHLSETRLINIRHGL